MAATLVDDITDFIKQAVHEKEELELFENEVPLKGALENKSESYDLTQKGYRIPVVTRRPGGHTFFSPSSSSFNANVSMATNSMYVFPTYYAIPFVFSGSLIRGFQKAKSDALMSMASIMKQTSMAARKHLNYMWHGDGSGALAFSNSTIGSTGSSSINFTTAANTTPGETKGGVRLEEGHTYQAINTSTGAVRGTFTVTTPGKTSATINVTSGTISSGDPLVHVGSYNKCPRGIWHLINDTSRLLQGLLTSTFIDLKSPMIDLAGALLTPDTINKIKAYLQVRSNSKAAKNGILAVLTPGQGAQLRSQGYGFRQYGLGQPMEGVAQDYKDGDTEFLEDADGDEDRVAFIKRDRVAYLEEKEFGPYNHDGLEMRMYGGSNNTGSDDYFGALGTSYNPAITLPRACAGVKRALITGIVTQATS